MVAGYAKGEETRLRIIETAIELFGEQGYERASTRNIAAAAGVNSPALQYYFKGKAGLYTACADHIMQTARLQLDPVIEEVLQATQSKQTVDQLIAHYCRLQATLFNFLLEANGSGKWSLFMARDRLGLDGRDAFRHIKRKFGSRYVDLCAALIGRITGRKADDPETLVRLTTINAQIFPFQRPEGTPLDAMSGTRMAGDIKKLAADIIREQTTAILRACARP